MKTNVLLSMNEYIPFSSPNFRTPHWFLFWHNYEKMEIVHFRAGFAAFRIDGTGAENVDLRSFIDVVYREHANQKRR